LLEDPHVQDFYSLLLIRNATGTITIDDEQIPLESGMFVVIKPGCISKMAINKEAIGTLIVFSENFFSLRYNNNMLNQFAFLKQHTKPYKRLKDKQVNHFNVLAGLIQSEFENKQRERVKALRSYLNIILLDLERCWPTKQIPTEPKQQQERLRRFESLVEERFIEWKMPSEYARQLFVTPNYLNKICKRELGQTAGEIIRKRIIIESQRLLHYTQMTVTEVAEKLGFESPSYFITFFKKYIGMTPEQFRRFDQ
jgi:AraC-like DNA-binding protein